jgi:hypothetical protein
MDLTASAHDLSAGEDLKMANVGCHGYVACMNDCFMTPGATSAGCNTMCGKQANTGAAAKYNAALTCCQAHCAGPADMPYKCMLDPTTNNYVNLDGTPISGSDPGTGLKQCNQCLVDSCAALFMNPCTSMSSVDCSTNSGDPIGCDSVMMACASDLP